MPRLLAIIPEDGWAMVRDGEVIFFVRPPFRKAERIPLSEATFADAVALHGYEPQPDAPEEPWLDAIERVRGAMILANKGRDLPSNDEILSRLLRSGPSSVLTQLLNRIEREWLPQGDIRASERALNAVFAEDRVRDDRALLDRAMLLRQTLDEVKAQKNALVPIRAVPDRIQRVAKRPEVVRYKASLKRAGSAKMVA